jgi:hypothetical protein
MKLLGTKLITKLFAIGRYIMKAHNSNDGPWYGEWKISSLIKSYAPHVNTLTPVSASSGLPKQLGHIQQNGHYFIPLNINCLSQNFEEGKNNHWAGLYVIKDTYHTTVLYLDPMGKPINPQLASEIGDILGTNSISQLLLNKSIQCVQLDSAGSFIAKGNDADCGPFLVYCVACIANGKSIRQD